MPELGERCGLRRHTGSTWVRPDTAPGLAGLQEKRRAPHRLSAAREAVLVEAKPAPPHGGPRQILPSRARPHPARRRPAPSPAGKRFQRAGLRPARHRRRRPRPPGASPLQAAAPTAVWTAAFTGQCRPGAGRDGSPVPVADAESRLR
jgi:putative transposase